MKKYRIIKVPVCGSRPKYQVEQEETWRSDDSSHWEGVPHSCLSDYSVFYGSTKSDFPSHKAARKALDQYIKYLEELKENNIVEEINL